MREAGQDRWLKWAFAVALALHAAALAAGARLPAEAGHLNGEFEEIRVFDAAAPALLSPVELVEWPAEAAVEVELGSVVELSASVVQAPPREESRVSEPPPVIAVRPPQQAPARKDESGERAYARPTEVAGGKLPSAELRTGLPNSDGRRTEAAPERAEEQASREDGNDGPPGGGGGGGFVDLGSPSASGDLAGAVSGGTPAGQVPGQGAGMGSGVGPGEGGGSGGGTGGGVGTGEGTGVGEGSGTGTGVRDSGTGGPGFASRVADRREPEVVSKGSLEYPAAAVRDGVEGAVKLKVLVTEGGEVAEVVVEESSGHKRLDAAAVEFVRGWRYRPAVQDGRARQVYTYARVAFELQ